MSIHPQSCVDSAQLSRDHLQKLLSLATGNLGSHSQTLTGQTVATLFYEASTRTRCSFELAAKRLGAHTLNLDVQVSSHTKGETVADTVDTLVSLGVNAAVVRHTTNHLPHQLAEQFGKQLAVLNAGDGTNDHPTQGLLDCLTLAEHWGFAKQGLGCFEGKQLVIVGDVRRSRVARANVRIAKTLGLQVTIVAPEVFHSPELQAEGASMETDLLAAAPKADALMTLRIQKERFEGEDAIPEDYIERYQLNHSILKQAKPSVPVLHPGPVNRDVELSSELLDDQARCLVREQVQNGLRMRQAVLLNCLTSQSAG